MTQLGLIPRAGAPNIIVSFAGIGGTCEGFRRATGASPGVAINHSRHALAVHALNHPSTIHMVEDVWNASLRRAARGRPVDALWMSPDCTHHSRARGGKPRENDRRGLAEVIFQWLDEGVLPKRIFLENVEEFEGWGPLGKDGRPIKERKGELFRAWVRRLEGYGYRVEWRSISACDHGAPTTRRRLYLIARRDDQPIRWPEPTHGPGRRQPWRTAAECIDWSIPAPSIFERPRPLADATLRRIAAGLVKFVLEAEEPFILCLTHGGRLEPVSEPMRTITTAKRGERALITPYLVRYQGEKRPGETHLAHDLREPINTIPTQNRFGLAVPYLVANNTNNRPHGVREPVPTVTTGNRNYLIAAWLAKHYTGVTGQPLDRPLGTVTTVDHHSLCTARLAPEEEVGARRVAAFLTSYYGHSVGQSPADPLGTVTTKDRFGLVTVTLEGQPYVVVDIGMRMLQPRELARAMGFPDSYVLEGTKTQQVADIGNAVCPDVAQALVRANM